MPAGSGLRKNEPYFNTCLLVLVQLVLGRQQFEELAAGAILQDEVELLLVLEAGDHLHQEGVVDASQYLLLGHDVLLLILLDDVFLLEDLEGEQLAVGLAGDQADLGVGALADDRVVGEVVDADLLVHADYIAIN